jgi:hypothetical protein
MGVAFRELPGGRSQWRLPQSRDRGLQGSAHCGYCVHGSHLLPTDHDRQDASTPAARVRNRHHADCRVAVERAADRHTLIRDGPDNTATGQQPSSYQVTADATSGESRAPPRPSTDHTKDARPVSCRVRSSQKTPTRILAVCRAPWTLRRTGSHPLLGTTSGSALQCWRGHCCVDTDRVVQAMWSGSPSLFRGAGNNAAEEQDHGRGQLRAKWRPSDRPMAQCHRATTTTGLARSDDRHGRRPAALRTSNHGPNAMLTWRSSARAPAVYGAAGR